MADQVNGEFSESVTTESAAVNAEDEYFSSFPPGYRFKPFDEELIVDYLIKKVNNQPLPRNRIKEVQLYNYNPDTLAEMYKPNCEDEWYYFTRRDRKYPKGSRPDRGAGNGYWKASGATIPIFLRREKVGSKTSLCFYSRNQKKSKKTNWIMTEYKVSNDMKFDDWVLCKIRKLKEKPEETEKSRQPAEGQHNFGDSSFVRSHPSGIPGSSKRPFEQGHASSAHSKQMMVVAGHNNQSIESFLQPHSVPSIPILSGNSDLVHSHQSGFLGQDLAYDRQNMAARMCENYQPTESFRGQEHNYDGSNLFYSYPNGVPPLSGHPIEKDQASTTRNQQRIVVSCSNNQPTESFRGQEHNYDGSNLFYSYPNGVPPLPGHPFEKDQASTTRNQQRIVVSCSNNQPTESFRGQEHNYDGSNLLYSYPNGVPPLSGHPFEKDQASTSRNQQRIVVSCNNNQPTESFFQTHYSEQIMSEGNNICGDADFVYSHQNEVSRSLEHHKSRAYNQQMVDAACNNNQPRKGFLQPHYEPSIPIMRGGNHTYGDPNFAYSHWNETSGSSDYHGSSAYNRQTMGFGCNYNFVPRTNSDVGSSSEGQDVPGSKTPEWDLFFDSLEKDIKEIEKATKD